MANDYFSFKQFTIRQDLASFKVGTDGVLLGAIADLSGASKILDIGCGTGLIAIMAAQRSCADIIAVEPHEPSFRQALRNVASCPWSNRIKVFNYGLKEFSESSSVKFDALISNPPYFRNSLLNPDHSKSAGRHSYALSPVDILSCSVKLLHEEGSLQLILPYTEGTLFIAEAAGYGLFCNRLIKVKPNPAGEIIRLIMKFEKVRKETRESFLTIETGRRHCYSNEYKEITKDFYLKF